MAKYYLVLLMLKYPILNLKYHLTLLMVKSPPHDQDPNNLPNGPQVQNMGKDDDEEDYEDFRKKLEGQ